MEVFYFVDFDFCLFRWPLFIIILFVLYETTWSDLCYFHLFQFDLREIMKLLRSDFLCHCQLSFPPVQVCHMHLVFSWLRLRLFKWIHAKVPCFVWYLQQAGYLWDFSPGRSALLGCQQAECSPLSFGCFPVDLDRHWIRIIPYGLCFALPSQTQPTHRIGRIPF